MFMNLDVYNLRDIQLFISLLNQFESKGVSDVRFVREQLSRSLTERAGKIGRVRRISSPTRTKLSVCPSCGKGVLVGPKIVDRLAIVRCSLKCGYSRVEHGI